MRSFAPMAAAALACVVAPAAASGQVAPTTYDSLQSRLLSVEVTSVTPDKTYGGVAYVKVHGAVHGQVGINDFVAVHNLIDYKQNLHPENAGTASFPYESEFELIVPAAGQPQDDVIYVDSENRGSAVSQGALGGFLQNHATAYARIQWQTGISKGVPNDVQGVGLVIMRDFARWLGGRTPQTQVTGQAFKPVAYRKMILGGISQSAWLVNTFIAEGFNAEPVSGRKIFDAAVAVDGTGNWLAINQLAAARKVAGQLPYVDPNGVPLAREELLHNPRTDPLYVDMANYTDFYRLRAGMTSTDYSSPTFRRYDWPSPHAVGNANSGARCNSGQPVSFNTIRYAPYFRAVVLNVEKAIGVKAAQSAHGLPPSTVFILSGGAKNNSPANPLPGIALKTPAVDKDGWPAGGVRFPEVEHPTGRPDPVAIPPVNTSAISQTCGNFGGFKPFTAEELRQRYRDKQAYLAAYEASLDQLIGQGYLLAEDKAGMLAMAAAGWRG